MRRALIASYALIACLAPATVLAQTPPAAPPATSGCDSPESHQFDFWVGRWSVTPTANPGQHVADSLIEKLYQGCVVRENWMPLSGGAGGSLNMYIPGDKGWRQLWADASGAWVDFRGGFNGTAMVITGVWPQPGKPTQQTRMTYTRGADGSVRQFGQSSDDEGKTWQTSFDLTYHPVKP